MNAMNSIKTPEWDFNYLRNKDVYEPAEDTFVLLDALEKDIQELVSLKPNILLEIGCGSGVVITALASIFKNAFCLALDINMNACMVTKNTSRINDVQIDTINTDLLNNIRLKKMIDVIVFNPPYVATETSETCIKGVTQSWAGGENGRKIVDRLLPSVSEALSFGGIFYLVAISYNDVEGIILKMKEFNLDGEVIMRRQIRGELLFILKFQKNKSLETIDR